MPWWTRQSHAYAGGILQRSEQLSSCPANASSFEVQEAPAYSEAAVPAAKLVKNIKKPRPAEVITLASNDTVIE